MDIYDKGILLSICIPSYNRGHRALELVKSVLEFECPDIEIVVSNNGSTKNIEGYKAIQAMQSERLQYNEFEENQQYVGNINKVIKMARGRFCLIISDEDMLDKEGLYAYLDIMKNNPHIGAIRTATSVHYNGIEDIYLEAGIEAIEGFFLVNNYLSGIIYNRSVISDEVIDVLAMENSENIAYRLYTHMIIDIYAMLAAGVLRSSKMLVIEGRSEDTNNERYERYMHGYASVKGRLEQMKGYLDIIDDIVCCDADNIKCTMVQLLILKTLYMIGYIRKYYIESQWEEMIKIINQIMKKHISSMRSVVIVDNRELINMLIDELMMQVLVNT